MSGVFVLLIVLILLFRSSPRSHSDFVGTFFANGSIFSGHLLLRSFLLLNWFNSGETKPKNAEESMREVNISLQSADFSLLSITLSHASVIA